MWVKVPRDTSVVDEYVDVPMSRFYDIDDGKQTFAVCNIPLNWYDLIMFLEGMMSASNSQHGNACE